MQTPAPQIIALFGGPSKLARFREWPISTVYDWSKNQDIPDGRRFDVLGAAVQAKIYDKLTPPMLDYLDPDGSRRAVLFNVQAPRYPDAPGYSNETTSKDAAASIAESAPDIGKRILAMIANTPSTCYEVEQALGLSHQTASARITHLRQKGEIEDSGITRPTASGRAAIVWQAKPAKEGNQ